MQKFAALRLLLLLFFVTAAIFAIHNFQPVGLPVPSSLTIKNIQEEPLSRTDDCIVSEEAAEVHYKEGDRNYEEALIDYVNGDSTVQVTTIDTKLSLLFWVPSDVAKCFREGSIAQVTIAECKKNQKGECDFSLAHTVYIRTESVNVLNWKYY